MAVLCLTNNAVAEENIILNPGFEAAADNALPQAFFVDAYHQQPNVSQYTVSEDISHSGERSAYLKNNGANDARFAQMVEVEPNTYYKLSGYIMAGGITEGRGANLSVEGVYSFTEALYDTQGEWKYVELFGKTGPEQKKLTVYARLGGYSGESKGYAYFDDISLTRVSEEDVQGYDNWYAAPKQNKSAAESETSHGLLLFIGLAYLLFALWLLHRSHGEYKRAGVLFAVGFVFALALRLYIANAIYGYQVDMGCFIGWANALHEHGIGGFYGSGIFCDYPPGYLWLLRINGAVFAQFGMDDSLLRLVTKTVPILCDMLAVLLLYRLVRKSKGNGMGCIVSMLYAFNPLVILLSAAWGQIDAVFALLIALAFYLLTLKKEHFGIILYVLACLIKPQGLIFGPIALVYLIRHGKDIGLKKIAIGLGASLALFVAVAAPFTPQSAGSALNFSWLLELYGKVLGSYEYATINTANIYYILGGNWLAQNTVISPIFLSVFALLMLVPAILLLRRKKGIGLALLDPDSRPKSYFVILFILYALAALLLAVFGGSYLAFGNLSTIFAVAFCAVLVWTLPKERFVYAMAMMLLIVYNLGMRMHERYLFAAVLLFLVDYAVSRHKKSLLWALFISCSVFINSGIVLDNSLVLGSAKGHLNLDSLWINNALSIYNSILLLFAVYDAYTLHDVKEVATETAVEKKTAIRTLDDEQNLPPAKIDRKDVMIMLAVCIVYAFFAFYQLGSMLAPQTGYDFSNDNEEIVLDLGEERDFNVLYYGGINYSTVYFSAGNDMQNWSADHRADLSESQIFRWKYLSNFTMQENGKYNYSHEPMILRGRYLRIRAEEAGVNLWEIAVRSPYVNGQAAELYPIVGIVSHEGMDEEFAKPEEALRIFDEQNTVPEQPGLFNSTYFDEIYHARTGYEHLHGIRPYETSHPPLGKLFMTLGIWLFGMTPFGYRFFGAFIGILMLPTLYITAKYLFRNRKYAFAAMFLFAVDLMHLTQTRIATIDSYPVFFIMLSYLFMLRYTLLNHANIPLRKVLAPLLWSGIFFGLSVASKWIGLYAGMGLAILFFTSIASQIKRCDEPISPQNPAVYRAAQTALFCILFFIIIPALLYFVSYIPYFAPSGGISVQRLIDTQQSMLRYHSTPGLGADHPYQSPWWQWPLILKPMWYALNYYEPQGYNQTIFAMGNPAVFYVSFVAIILTLLGVGLRMIRVAAGKRRALSAEFFIGIAFLSQYLPWVIVPRSTYIYHYFASVPFIILAGCFLFRQAEKAFPKWKKWIQAVLVLYLLTSFAMFIAFYPYATGILTSNSWLDAMKWFKGIWY